MCRVCPGVTGVQHMAGSLLVLLVAVPGEASIQVLHTAVFSPAPIVQPNGPGPEGAEASAAQSPRWASRQRGSSSASRGITPQASICRRRQSWDPRLSREGDGTGLPCPHLVHRGYIRKPGLHECPQVRKWEPISCHAVSDPDPFPHQQGQTDSKITILE